jgi:predicted small lipoprotein YifL
MRLFSLPLLLAMMTALAGCNFKGVPDPQVSSRDA